LNFPPQVLQKELGKTKQLTDVYAILDCDVPMVIAAATINDEFYWKRRTLHRDRGDYTGNLEQHGCSWKQFYLETELEFILENFPLDFVQAELDELKALIHA